MFQIITKTKPFAIVACMALVVFISSLVVGYYPIHKKGYSSGGDTLNLIKARNYAAAGAYHYESSNGVLLSTDHVLAEGKKTGLINPLTPIIYGQIFKYWDINKISGLPERVSLICAAIFNLLAFFIIRRLFGGRVGFISAMVMTFMPFRIIGSLSFGLYDFAMIFFAIATWLILGSKNGVFKGGNMRIGLASIFFALAALARNAFLISFIPFVLYDFYKSRSIKRIFVFILPFVIIFGSTLTSYSWLGVSNGYIANINNQPFDQLGEVFPDPYTAYYNRDNFLQKIKNDGLDRNASHFLGQWGYAVTIGEKVKAYKESLKAYIVYAFDLIMFGGPLILLLMLLGAYRLYQNRREIFWFFNVWLGVWLAGLVYFQTGNWDHLLEIIFIPAILTGLGIWQIAEFLKPINMRKTVVSGMVLSFVLGHLAYANKWSLYDSYRSSRWADAISVADKVKLAGPGVIAAGIHPTFANGLNYLANRDIIYFNPNTTEELIANGKLKEAFEIYHVKTVVGFSDSVSNSIKKMTNATVINIYP